jgi:guanylate kinase
MTVPEPGKLVVISGPSGVGKSTVVRGVLEQISEWPLKDPHLEEPIRLSVSATTRPPRPGEVDGIDYHFLSKQEFSERRQAGDFLECIEVFGQGHWYGTLWDEVRPSLQAGKWVILEIDVDGAQGVLQHFPTTVTIFIRPESIAELQRRLRSRNTESEEAINRRLAVARRELELTERYDHVVVNITVSKAVESICQILRNRGLSND